jgi:hypothetical protein
MATLRERRRARAASNLRSNNVDRDRADPGIILAVDRGDRKMNCKVRRARPVCSRGKSGTRRARALSHRQGRGRVHKTNRCAKSRPASIGSLSLP